MPGVWIRVGRPTGRRRLLRGLQWGPPAAGANQRLRLVAIGVAGREGLQVRLV